QDQTNWHDNVRSACELPSIKPPSSEEREDAAHNQAKLSLCSKGSSFHRLVVVKSLRRLSMRCSSRARPRSTDTFAPNHPREKSWAPNSKLHAALCYRCFFHERPVVW